MTHKSIRISLAFAHQIMNQLGNVENGIEFVDLNRQVIETKKPYYSLISRCMELEKAFLKFEVACEEKKVTFAHYKNFELFNEHIDRDISARDKVLGSVYFDLIEGEVLDDEKKIDEHQKIDTELTTDYIKLLQEKYIVEKLNLMFHKGEIVKIEEKDIESETSLNYIAGICNSIDEIKIKRMIFRISKGRAIPGFFDINLQRIKEYTKNPTEKKMFFILIQGSFLKRKVMNLLNIFNSHIYNIPHPDEICNILNKTQKELQAKEKLILESEKTYIEFLSERANKRKVRLFYITFKGFCFFI